MRLFSIEKPQPTECFGCKKLIEPILIKGFFQIPTKYLLKDLCDACEQETINAQKVNAEIKKLEQTKRELNLATGLPKIFQTASFENFIKTPENNRAFNLAKQFYPYTKGLWLIGDTGVGKTHLISAIINKWIHSGWFFITMPDLVAKCREGRSNEFINFCKKIPHLVLDDMGKENVTDFSKEILYSILDHRYSNSLSSFFTSNYTPDFLKDKYGEPLVSRMCAMVDCVLVKDKIDRRMKRGF